mgnify:CR=1 FL=1
MKKLIIFFLFSLYLMILYATLHKVALDGSQNFLSVQSAINNAVDGDSILVYPGIYNENISYLGKSLQIGSLTMTTGDTCYVATTILNGVADEAVVLIENCANAGIYGFTIQNGKGKTYDPIGEGLNLTKFGGGIYAELSTLTISSCYIWANSAFAGGGLYLLNCNLILSGNTITRNSAFQSAGGIFIGEIQYEGSSCDFDAVNKNSIYLNTGAILNDIEIVLPYNIDIPLQKVTIDIPLQYNDFYIMNTSIPQQELNLTYEETALTEINSDLYVSPDGSDNNTGLNPLEPLKTISRANALIQSDSLNIKTIYVANGTYSVTNGELLPIHLKPFVKVIGESRENTIIDGEHQWTFFHGGTHIYYNSFPGDIHIENLKLINSIGHPFRSVCSALFIGSITNSYLKNITIDNTVSEPYYWLTLSNGTYAKHFSSNIDMKMNYVSFPQGSSMYENFPWAYSLLNPYEGKLENIKIDGFGGGLHYDSYHQNEHPKNLVISNTLVSNCFNRWTWPAEFYVGFGLYIEGTYGTTWPAPEIKVINSSFINNRSNTGPLGIYYRAKADFYNTLFYNNFPPSLYFNGREYQGSSLFKNCFTDNGINDFNVIFDWDLTTENILSGNPQLLGNGEYPYALSGTSSCINAGTMDIPDYEFPEFDLAGNPRVFNGMVDIGAYEYQSVHSDTPPQVSPKSSVSIYPNPVRLSHARKNLDAKIKVNLEKAGNVSVNIYNIKGQKIKNIMQAKSAPGEFNPFWDGKDQQGQTVATGVYFLKMTIDDEEHVHKFTVVK